MLLVLHMVTITTEMIKKSMRNGLNYNPLNHWKKYLIAGTDREDWVHE